MEHSILCFVHGTKESIIMTQSIDSGAVLRQAQQVHKQSESTHKKGVQTEANDMKKANSIFTEAEKIINAEADKGIKVGEAGEQDINKLKQDAEKIGSSEVSPVKTLIETYKKALEEALQKKEELEQNLKSDEQEAAKELSVSKNVQKQIKTNAKSAAKPDGGDGNNEVADATEVVVSEEGADVSEREALMQEYRDTLAQIDALTTLTSSLGDKLETSIGKISSIIDRVESKKSSTEQKLGEIQTNINTKSAQKRNELNPLIQSQANDSQVHSQRSETAAQMSNTASQTAAQLDEQDMNKVPLEAVSKELSADSIELSDLSTQKNTPNAQTNIPKLRADIQQALDTALKGEGGLSNLNDAIIAAYNEAIGVAQSYDVDVKPTDSEVKTETAEITTEQSQGKVDVADIAQSAVGSFSGGSDVKGVIIDVVAQVADSYFKGAGSVVRMLGGLFG